MKLQRFIIAIGLLVMASCTQAQNKNNIDVKTFASATTGKQGITILDVRTPEEYAEGHIKGAKNIDWLGNNFSEQISVLDKKKPVYVYCRSGKRSAEAAKDMRSRGFEQVYELDGGIMDWQAAGQPVE